MWTKKNQIPSLFCSYLLISNSSSCPLLFPSSRTCTTGQETEKRRRNSLITDPFRLLSPFLSSSINLFSSIRPLLTGCLINPSLNESSERKLELEQGMDTRGSVVWVCVPENFVFWRIIYCLSPSLVFADQDWSFGEREGNWVKSFS